MNNTKIKEQEILFNEIFYSEVDLNNCKNLVKKSLENLDDGELFLEYAEVEVLSYDDNRIKHASFDSSNGFGLRGIKGEKISYSFNNIINEKTLKEAANLIKYIEDDKLIYHGHNNLNIKQNELYSNFNPIKEISFKQKILFLEEINDYIRTRDKRVKQVTLSTNNSWQIVNIISKEGNLSSDIRPLVRLNISVIMEENGRKETGSSGFGGRYEYTNLMHENNWKKHADNALRQASINLKSISSPAGELPVILGPGWPAVLLHEAVGHGLEGDFNRKGSSNFSNLMGKKVAANGVTIIDDGTIKNRRGSLNIDDEGNSTKKNVLIQDGILVGYLQDKLNARLTGGKPTGNGRREGYSSQPIPRMTNTFMLPGTDKPEDIISSVKRGIYAANFSGGQVDITSGNFVFSAQEAYMVENGKITSPIKGATLIGGGPDIMNKIVLIGNDLELDEGIGTCGKAGQSVAVGVGQPTLLISSITVGGTNV